MNTEIKVHPVAALFPMMTEEELQDLAADIETNGQNQPIVIDDANGELVLIDGRNRLKACEIAGIEPRTEPLNGRDPVALILSLNIARRHMNAGQRAIVVAKALNLSCKLQERKRDGRKENAARAVGADPARISQAALILTFAPELADLVLAGTKPLNDAYDEARRRKADAETNAEKMARLLKEAPDLADLAGMSLQAALDKLEQRKAEAAQLKTIEDDAPDLVRLVDEGRISVSDAMGVFTRREEEQRNAQSGATMLLSQIVQLIDVGLRSPKEVATRLMENVNPKMWPQDVDELTGELLKACGDMLIECSKILKGRGK